MFQSLDMSFFTALTISTIIFLILVFKWTLSRNPSLGKNLPPSPPRLPIIGNLHQLGTYPQKSLRDMSLKYGARDLMLLRFGSKSAIVASSVAAAKEILKTQDANFADRPRALSGKKLLYNYRDIVASSYGEYLRQMKSVCVFHLLSTKNVRSFGEVRKEETALMVETIRKSINSQVNLSDIFTVLASDILCRVTLGRRLTNCTDLQDLLKKHGQLLGATIGDYIPLLSWTNRVNGTISRMDKVANGVDQYLEQMISDHNQQKQDGIDQDGSNNNFLDILLRGQMENTLGFPIDRTSIKGIILDMLSAGMATTYTALDWAMAELIRNPTAMKRLQDEVRAVSKGKTIITEDDIQKMSYLKAVLKESFRLHPPVPLLIPRVSSGDVKVLGYDVASGTRVFVNVWAIGRDPTIWGYDGPEEFRPERFLGSPIDFKGQHFELASFGVGRRGCPGIGFATTLLEIGLANVVCWFDWSLPSGVYDVDMSESIGLSSHRKSPLLAIPKLAC